MKEYIDEILERYNPENKVMTNYDYHKYRELYLAGANQKHMDKYVMLAFYEAGLWLRSDYIINLRDESHFEEDLLETYFCALEMKPTAKTFKGFQDRFYRELADHFEALREEEREANIYLNFDYNNEIQDVEDSRAQAEIYDKVRESEIESQFYKVMRKLNYDDEKIKVLYESFGLKTSATITEVAKKYGMQSKKLCTDTSRAMRKLRSPQNIRFLVSPSDAKTYLK